MAHRNTLNISLFTGLTALPLFLLLGCSESGLNANSRDTFSQAQLADTSRGIAGEGGTEYPTTDCEKTNSRKVLVCHVPPGNPDEKHTICVSEAGAANGHGLNLADPYEVGGHGGDRLGACEVLEAAATGVSEPEGG